MLGVEARFTMIDHLSLALSAFSARQRAQETAFSQSRLCSVPLVGDHFMMLLSRRSHRSVLNPTWNWSMGVFTFCIAVNHNYSACFGFWVEALLSLSLAFVRFVEVNSELKRIGSCAFSF
jgi:hypothetical protein